MTVDDIVVKALSEHPERQGLIRHAVRIALEEAAQVCDTRSAQWWDKYKHGDGPERANPHCEGQSDGADACSAAIRAMIETEADAEESNGPTST